MEMLSTSIELARRSNALTQLRTITNRTHVRYVHLPIPHVMAEKKCASIRIGGYSYTPLSYSIKLMKIYMKCEVHPSNLHARPMRRRAAIQTLPTPHRNHPGPPGLPPGLRTGFSLVTDRSRPGFQALPRPAWVCNANVLEKHSIVLVMY